MNTKQTALDAYLARKAAIHARSNEEKREFCALAGRKTGKFPTGRQRIAARNRASVGATGRKKPNR